MVHDFQNFGVIGAGAWGTALATTLVRAGRKTLIWSHTDQVATAINTSHENKDYLPGIKLPQALAATSNLADMAGCEALIVASPAQHVREILQKLALSTPLSTTPIILAAKGIEQGTSKLLSDVVAETLPNQPIAILSGPSFAHEVAAGLPAALTLAIADKQVGEKLAAAMSLPIFRLYQTSDIIGAQIGGAIKNVLAVACGVISGRQFGENARAALITRGLAEMMRLGVAMGGRAETLMGLSGMGDLVLTCSSTQSRNMSLGFALGQGQKLADILASRTSVSEGVYTASAALALAHRYKVEMPIVTAVDAILNHGAEIDRTITELLSRPLTLEHR
jgi:glycerol-3-phosphate dehydrogenase (NAD(P)+)